MKTETQEWRRQPRDRYFRGLLIDTFVLPTIRCSMDGGETWAEGEGIQYLAAKLNVPVDRDLLEQLVRDWHQFTGLRESPQTQVSP